MLIRGELPTFKGSARTVYVYKVNPAMREYELLRRPSKKVRTVVAPVEVAVIGTSTQPTLTNVETPGSSSTPAEYSPQAYVDGLTMGQAQKLHAYLNKFFGK